MELSGSKFLVTGGAGLIGSHIVDQLVEAGAAEIRVFDNLSRGGLANLESSRDHPSVSIVEGDIRDVAQLRDATAGVDGVFHLAALRITHCAENPRLALETLVDGTFNVAEAAVDAGVGKLVFSSSASVLGDAESFPTTERHHPYNNRTFYGAAKAFGELMLRTFNEMYDLDYIALRYFNVYGPRMDIYGVYTEVLIRWMERLTAGQAPLILGDGSQTMDFIFVTDIARANLAAMASDVTDQVFNVATGTPTSLLELATALSKVMGSDIAPEHGPERKVNAVRHRQADVSLARELLGFEALVDLDSGLEQLVEWWQAQPADRPEEGGE